MPKDLNPWFNARYNYKVKKPDDPVHAVGVIVWRGRKEDYELWVWERVREKVDCRNSFIQKISTK